MGPQPTADCDGVVCMGYSGNGHWQTCVPPTIYCLESIVPCGPPVVIDPIIADPCERLMCQPPFDP